MTSYSSTLTVESQAFPGVRFTLKKMSEARRAEFRLKTAGVQARLRDLNAEAAPLLKQLKAAAEAEADVNAELDPVTEARVKQLAEEIQTIVACEMNPEYVRWGLKSLDGLEIDGEPATVDTLIADGPPELFAEICGAIIAASSMSEAELKNFKLPSISGGQTDGSGKITTADSASSVDGSGNGTAPSTSQT